MANEIYDKLTILLNNTRKKFDIRKGRPIDPLRKYDNFKLSDDGELAYIVVMYYTIWHFCKSAL